VLGIYFAFNLDTEYVLTEEVLAEYEKKKHILKKNDEIKR
jgi:hypothetical protein